MVSFVKPNLLGSSKEFRNRFDNPITNGQCRDSTAFDVRVMKQRAHVLHTLLDGTVQVTLLQLCYINDQVTSLIDFNDRHVIVYVTCLLDYV